MAVVIKKYRTVYFRLVVFFSVMYWPFTKLHNGPFTTVLLLPASQSFLIANLLLNPLRALQTIKNLLEGVAVISTFCLSFLHHPLDWLFGHRGIPGNCKVDELARASTFILKPFANRFPRLNWLSGKNASRSPTYPR